MKCRALRYSSANLGSLAANAQHELAHNHSLTIYESGAIYSMIPKNACSSLRLSIAISNGTIADEGAWRWIHNNNTTFRPTLRDLATANYTFAILRCPYSRLVSCFLDKIVLRKPDAWHFHKLIDEELPLARLTFRRFCLEMAEPRIRHSNIHWRPQVDFLVYKSYDALFCVEDFDSAVQSLKEKIDLTVVDSRPLVQHDAGRYIPVPIAKNPADMELWQLEAMMMNGQKPSAECFFDEGLRELLAEAYREDFRLYRQLFLGKGLFDALPLVSLAS